jgi:hypothetical protein
VEWLNITQPTVAVISTGDGNSYRHPASDCLERLHEAEVSRVYWTERGEGGEPSVNDVIAGDITIEVPANPKKYTVSYGNGVVETFNVKHPSAISGRHNEMELVLGALPSAPKYAWSIRADHYFPITCPIVNRISKQNLQVSATPPADGKVLASCPTRPAQ